MKTVCNQNQTQKKIVIFNIIFAIFLIIFNNSSISINLDNLFLLFYFLILFTIQNLFVGKITFFHYLLLFVGSGIMVALVIFIQSILFNETLTYLTTGYGLTTSMIISLFGYFFISFGRPLKVFVLFTATCFYYFLLQENLSSIIWHSNLYGFTFGILMSNYINCEDVTFFTEDDYYEKDKPKKLPFNF
jgi:hypothetical protein